MFFLQKNLGKDKVTVLVKSYRFMGQSYRLFRDRVTVYESCRYSSESYRFMTKLAFISKHKVTVFYKVTVRIKSNRYRFTVLEELSTWTNGIGLFWNIRIHERKSINLKTTISQRYLGISVSLLLDEDSKFKN